MRHLLLILLLSSGIVRADGGEQRFVAGVGPFSNTVNDIQLNDHFVSFINDAVSRGYTPDIRFFKGARLGDLSRYNDTRVGMCDKGTGYVTISETFPLTQGPLYLRHLVYHELFHCMLDAEHTTEGLMKPSFGHLDVSEGVADWQGYLDRAFTHIDPKYKQ